MTCRDIRVQMELNFGFEPLSPEIVEHLAHCAECRAYHNELAALAAEFNAVADIEFTEQEVGRAVALVDEAIAQPTRTTIVPINWMRRLTRVAAAVLIVAASWSAYRFGLDEGQQLVYTSEPAATTYLASADDSYADESEYIDEDMVDALIQSYSPGGLVGSDQYLVGDLSDEEMQYLMEHFDVGELL